MKIFNIIFGVLLCLAPVALRADDVECGYFNPAFGLCSTHSHNIGYVDGATNLPTNPDKSEDVSQMNHIIALKSTVIAQQLKDQYDALSVIIKRFKTQLEKAVLVSKIEVLTGNTASENSNGSSNNSGSSNGGLTDAEDCYSVSKENVYDCISRNLTKISQVAEKDITNARKQLKNDLAVMDGYDMCGAGKNCAEETNGCKDHKVDNMNSKTMQSCIKNLKIKVGNAKSDFDMLNAKARWGGR
ncbi:MAG: hypothetical protein J6S80_03485 [Alphaproteobacteria bacterium]|nr:hypothetical protein [Alphaproteobacteria bacterium]